MPTRPKRQTARKKGEGERPERGKRLPCDIGVEVDPGGPDCWTDTKPRRRGRNIGYTRRLDGKPCQASVKCVPKAEAGRRAASKARKAMKSLVPRRRGKLKK